MYKMKTSVPLILFDLDGTLVDTLEDLAVSTNEALRQFGCPPHRLEDYRYLVGNGARRLIERALPDEFRSEETILCVQKLYEEHYAKHFLDHSKPYDGMEETLRSLRADGCRLAVVSNKPHEFAEQMVRTIFGENLFFSVLGHRVGAPHKPDPLTVYETIALADATTLSTVYVGDSNVDVETGRNANLPVIGCAWGFRGAEELITAGADRIAFEPKEIRSFVKEFLISAM